MEKRLTEDLNVVANSDLEIQLLDGDLNIIQKLDDEPNDVGGLSSAQLKAKFDESGNIIKTYINETLIPAVLADDATEATRSEAEAARAAAEQGRVTAEEGRVSAEDARVAAETVRASAESARETAENARAAAEQARADENTGIVAQATAQARAAAESAVAAAGSAQTAQSAAGTASGAAEFASQAATAASGSASQAQSSAAAAAQSAASLDGINKTAQSWAVGGTGTRPGEDTNNAKYWAQQAAAAVGGDFATKTEAQGYVSTHNQSVDAHADIREALNGKAAGTHASQHGANGSDPVTPDAIGAIAATDKGTAGGVASLDTDGKVPSSQLPEISSVKTYTATIGTTWTEDSNTGVKTQTVTISGVTASQTAKVDHAYTGSGTSNDYAAFVEAENQYLTYITNGYAETVAGGIKFTIFGDANTVSIPIVVEVS